ncbi:hypothetical protein ElyMa_003940200 [Elysia marginata]|uniref:Uncharacterized protein n=1 Tax=Elysia marginata TaxID=1093978 RepID=A0AAV4FSC2_9GAST|nr:hypothetical protein ElyMa_003940200 [Elysia marginata]
MYSEVHVYIYDSCINIRNFNGTELSETFGQGIRFETTTAPGQAKATYTVLHISDHFIFLGLIFALVSCVVSVMGTMCVNVLLHCVYNRIQDTKLSQDKVLPARLSQIV